MKIFDTIKELIPKARRKTAENNTNTIPVSGEANTEGAANDCQPDDERGKKEADSCSWGETVKAFQIGFYDFTTEKGVIGFYIDPNNRWVKLSDEVFKPGMEEIYEQKLRTMRDTTRGERLSERLKKLEQDDEVAEYEKQMVIPNIDLAVEKAKSDKTKVDGEWAPGNAGRCGYSFRIVFGFLVIQGILDISDRDVCKMVSESPYLQYFLGYESFSVSNTVHPTSLVHFKKRLDWETMEKLNEVVRKSRVESKGYRGDMKGDANGEAEKEEAFEREEGTPCEKISDVPARAIKNAGTLILDATCGPVNIRFPQDFSLLNEARTSTEGIIDRICEEHNISKPRTYVKVLQKAAKDLSKTKKKKEEQIRHVVKLELNAIERNLKYIEGFLKDYAEVELSCDEVEKIMVTRALYAQQKYMFENRIHRVTKRIVSFSEYFIRPISRGKADRPTEFGPKYDISVDENGHCSLTHFSFENNNESKHLKDAVEKYKKKTGHYPERVLADQIYRNTENRNYCKENGIRLSGPKLGRKPKDEEVLLEQLRTEKEDMTDRIGVERHFSRQKRCFGIEEIVERTFENIGHAVGMSVFLDNVVPVGF